MIPGAVTIFDESDPFEQCFRRNVLQAGFEGRFWSDSLEWLLGVSTTACLGKGPYISASASAAFRAHLICVCIQYIYIYIYIYCIHIVYTNMYMYMYMYMYMHMYMYMYMYMYMHMYMYMYVCVYIHIYIYIHTRASPLSTSSPGACAEIAIADAGEAR